MTYESIVAEIIGKLELFKMELRPLPFPPIERGRFVVLVPENEYKTLIKGSGLIDFEPIGGELTIYGVRIRKTKESKIIVGVE